MAPDTEQVNLNQIIRKHFVNLDVEEFSLLDVASSPSRLGPGPQHTLGQVQRT